MQYIGSIRAIQLHSSIALPGHSCTPKYYLSGDSERLENKYPARLTYSGMSSSLLVLLIAAQLLKISFC